MNSELRQAGITPKRVPLPIRKKLSFANVLSQEIKMALKQKKNRKFVPNIVCGKILKKYRMLRKLSIETELTHYTIHTDEKKSCEAMPKRKANRIYLQIREEITKFLERDDNSRNMPGKDDIKTVNMEKKQKRILNDYIRKPSSKI